MDKPILFISDLHIALDKPDITKRFLRFLENQATHAEAVYILGDLFDAWIGDDDFTPPNNSVRKQLKKLTDSGVRVFLQPGNRDFLIGDRFAAETGIKLLDEYTVIDLYGVPTLLTHGDLLCTDDLPYQAFRIKSRNPAWQNKVLSKPLWLRLLAARWYRFKSYRHKRKKTLAIMDVNQHAVIQAMQKYKCLRLIHGHTHRPQVHELLIDGQPAQRFVLSQWHKNQAEILCWHDNAYKIEQI